ncbi:HupE/UreJ family protein [Shimia sp. Alg240-R146]|uniref:HupE/UreJ family protein n=1 Tax=Shimia sp. Alg240-R146 TaxID=2993449 RepID=UPI0022E92A59|nr:HupE/UreJ family protein [Shimia sp. Alg240-R146]
MIKMRLFFATIVMALFLPIVVFSHALEPGYLEIKSVAGDTYRVFWRKPDVQNAPMQVDATLPTHCDQTTGPAPKSDGQAWVATWLTNCPGGLAGGHVEIYGLAAQKTDVLVRYSGDTGQLQTKRLTPSETSFEIPRTPSTFDVIRSYLPLGVEHILEGFDHLLFVFALILLISDRWRLVGAITAFTVAHSITMAVATFGLISLPGPPVEAVIALSIMFLASELFYKGGETMRLSERFPWTVSFSFGLLHGFGFAGALREIGLPEMDIPMALLSFNLGVEIGQLLFVAAILSIGALVRLVAGPMLARAAPRSATWTVSVYAIGTVSAFWFIERLSGF